MILNNLDKAVAQFPQELVTYGGNGQVFSNWAQVRQHKNIQIIMISMGQRKIIPLFGFD